MDHLNPQQYGGDSFKGYEAGDDCAERAVEQRVSLSA